MDTINSQLDNLPELSSEELGELESNIVSEFDTFDNADSLTSQSVDSMTALADALDTVRGEVARREAAAEELSARKAELSSRVRGDAEEAPEATADAVVEESIEASATTEVEETAVSDETDTPELSNETEASVEEAATEAPAEAEAAIEEVATEDVAAEEETVVETEAAAEEVAEEETATDTEAAAKGVNPFDKKGKADDAEADEEDEEEEEEEVAKKKKKAAEASAEAAPEAEASNTEEETTTDEPVAQEEAQTVTATAGETPIVEAPADRRPVTQEPEAPVVAITAGADLPGVGAGQAIPSMSEVANYMADRIHSLRRVNGGDGEQVIVASLNRPYSEALTLDGTAEENSGKVSHSKENGALVASGGWGTPEAVQYDIFGFGTDARPVKDSLPKFQANRGGIRFVTPPQLSAYTGAVGVWTPANDVTAAGNTGTGDTLKDSLTVTGASEVSATTDAITLQLKIGNLLSRAYPELVARHNELALIQHARLAEQTLLAKIDSNSTQVTSTSTIGVARDFLVQVRRASAAYRSRHRIAPDTQLQAIIPMWVTEAMAADLTLNMPGDDNLSVGKAEIHGMLAKLNVTLTESYDQNVFGAQGTGAMEEFANTFEWYLFSEGTFLFLDGGTLDIGVVRDSGLVSTNDYKMFIETFEGVAFVGIESLAVTSTITVSGAAAALATSVDY